MAKRRTATAKAKKRGTAVRVRASGRNGKRQVKFFTMKALMKKKLLEVRRAMESGDISAGARRDLDRAEKSLDGLLRVRPWCGQPMVIDY